MKRPQKRFFNAAVALTMAALNPAYAEPNDGKFDCQWLSARIKTTLPIAVDWSDPQVGKVVKNVKFDSGPNKCYVLLEWQGVGSYTYQIHPVCENGDGVWREGAFLNNSVLYELDDGKSIASDWANVYLAQQNGIFYDTIPDNGEDDLPDNHAYVGYEGTLVLTYKADNGGGIKTISAKTKTGMIYAWDNSLNFGGTSKPTAVQLRFAPSDQVPSPAKNASGIEGICN